MIFVDTSVIDSAIGPPCSARDDAQQFFLKSLDEGAPLVTSAAVIFEVIANIDPAMQVRTDFLIELIRGRLPEVWDLEAEDVFLAQRLEYRFQELHGSGLIKLAACWRRGVHEIYTYDGVLRHAMSKGRRGTRLTGRDRARRAQQEWRESRWTATGSL